MKLLNRLTITSLKKNKKRTIVTIIGILLSVALLTAVSTMGLSFQASLISYEKQKDGDFHYGFLDMPKSEISSIEKNRNVESFFKTEAIGYVTLDESQNEGKPYLYIEGLDAKALVDPSVQLLEGRMPKNDSEIVISKHIETNGGVELKVGQTLTLEVGNRTSDKSDNLTQQTAYTEGEKLVISQTKTYTIVGVCQRFSMEMEPREAPGYTAFTYANENNDFLTASIYVRYKKDVLKDRTQITGNILGLSDDAIEAYFNTYEQIDEDSQVGKELKNLKYQCVSNDSLIEYETLDLTKSSLRALYSVAIVLLLIIIAASAFCIRNSFMISISDKMKQYGMLASVGATSKQIKRNVYDEAFLLGTIGIPLGIGVGILASFIVICGIANNVSDVLSIQLEFHISILAIILSCLLGIIVIFLSAGKPARMAGKVSPMEAITQVTEIKIESKKIKTPRFIHRCFGVGGVLAYKNMKRNRKKYRVSVISIVVSVAIFIAFYHFINLAFSSGTYYFGDKSYNLSVQSENMLVDYSKFEQLAKVDGVQESAIVREALLHVKIKDLPYTQEMKDYLIQNGTDFSEESLSDYLDVISLGKEQFQSYLKKIGLSTLQDNQVILVNDYLGFDSNNGRYKVFDIFDYQKGDKISGILDANNKKTELVVAAVTSEHPMGYKEMYMSNGFFVVSDEWMDSIGKNLNKYGNAYFNCSNPDTLQQLLEKDYGFETSNIYNLKKQYDEQRSLYTIMAVFLYGFIAVISLIGITNIFNTITTSMELRSKEFAMLKSIGMTRKEFRRMVCMESIFYGGKALMIGTVLGVALSVLISRQFGTGLSMKYQLPVGGIVISIIVVILLLAGIMWYSLGRVQKQNIIETIRQDNI